LILLFFSPLLSQLTWIGFNNISIFWTANIHFPSVQHCRFDNFELHFLRLPVVVVYDFTSSLSSLTSSLSSPYHRLGRLRLHLRFVVFAVFVYAITSSPSSLTSSPSSPSHRLDRLRRLCLRHH
ncbi:Uncharacterized protein APZ42_010208, partial [Daphnia magna]